MTYLRVGPLVRATGETYAVIWGEFSQDCEVVVSVTTYDIPKSNGIAGKARTINIGGHYYAATQLHGLQPGTWYNYHISIDGQEQEILPQRTTPFIQCFRTLDTKDATSLQFVYGSCRKLSIPQNDALRAFGQWLIEHTEQRETLWPHLLLLIGDQIYADQPPPDITQLHPHLHDGARTFEDFSLLYTYAWASNDDTRQVLAALPTYMIFDDHEIANNWNNTPTWKIETISKGAKQIIIDGLVAYWVYQGWGNLSPDRYDGHPLVQIMREAEQSGEDALEVLRASIKLFLDGKNAIHWHYDIATTPPIFVVNARAGRSEISADDLQEEYAPTSIMEKQQTTELQQWLQEHDTSMAMLVSSVPVLLPPLIGFAEYIMGVRPWWHSIAPLHKLGVFIARAQHRLATRMSFDHWPLYTISWRELVRMLARRHNDLLVLSGDVHFSYAMVAHKIFARGTKARLYQFVSTPLQNELGPKDERLIKRQSPIKHLIYGGLDMHILPLYAPHKDKSVQRDLLLQNVLSYVTLQKQEAQTYAIKQEYLGVVDGRMEVVGRTIV